ncbi:GTP-binding protein, partial [Candidatus Borrarchaeum sp.]|uniref:GTP-binding protein n=1 Tax=Candidatus Borrarchaeum sp. TaxID=2846742 RepID=UPI00257FC9DD
LIVYDITNEGSFKNVKKWYQEVKKHSAGIPIILVGNKSDLEEARIISSKEGEKIAKEIDCPFFEASAKTGENVEFIFRTLNNMLVEQAQKKKAKIRESKVRDSLMIDR